MMSEADHYPRVERWVKQQFGCWQTAINTGPKVGRIDVVGVRDVGGDLSGRSEVIAVEVKAGTQVFATSAGQAHGYSVMADRCYLADLRGTRPAFSDTELLIAGRLGIGLIALRPSGRVEECLTAPPNDPIEELRLQVIEKLGLALCSLCGTLFKRSLEGTNDWKGVTRSGNNRGPNDAAGVGRGFMWWLTTAANGRDKKLREAVYWRRYLCPDCTWNLFG